MSRQTQLFAQDGKLTVKAPPPELDTPTKRMREGTVKEMAKAWSDRLRSFNKERQKPILKITLRAVAKRHDQAALPRGGGGACV
jgi:hypothetical protein